MFALFIFAVISHSSSILIEGREPWERREGTGRWERGSMNISIDIDIDIGMGVTFDFDFDLSWHRIWHIYTHDTQQASHSIDT